MSTTLWTFRDAIIANADGKSLRKFTAANKNECCCEAFSSTSSTSSTSTTTTTTTTTSGLHVECEACLEGIAPDEMLVTLPTDVWEDPFEVCDFLQPCDDLSGAQIILPYVGFLLGNCTWQLDEYHECEFGSVRFRISYTAPPFDETRYQFRLADILWEKFVPGKRSCLSLDEKLPHTSGNGTNCELSPLLGPTDVIVQSL